MRIVSIRFKSRWLGLLLLSSCAVYRPPSSVLPGRYSATTGLLASGSRVWTTSAGINDFDVLVFKPSAKLCHDTFKLPVLRPYPLQKLGPGIVPLNNTGLGIDEAEVSNLEWKFYQEQTTNFASLNNPTRPFDEALPSPNYYGDPFYHRFPVVGISREQVEAFCRWRSRVATQVFNQYFHNQDTLSPDYFRLEYRLPTEAEWELAAMGGSGLPHGTGCLRLPVRVSPKAAAYLKHRSASPANIEQISQDIAAYNASKPTREWINYDQAEPYFLHLATPGYVWQGPPNNFGLYQQLGNAAEMVQEPGITKGGSYRDPLSACTIKARGVYAGPAPTTGFRCVCQTTFPNRK